MTQQTTHAPVAVPLLAQDDDVAAMTLPLLDAVQHLLSMLQRNVASTETYVRVQIVHGGGWSGSNKAVDPLSVPIAAASVTDQQPTPNVRLNVRPQPVAVANDELQRRWVAASSLHASSSGGEATLRTSTQRNATSSPPRRASPAGGVVSPSRTISSVDRAAAEPVVSSPPNGSLLLGRWQNTLRVKRDAYGVVASAARQSPRSAWIKAKEHRRRQGAAMETPPNRRYTDANSSPDHGTRADHHGQSDAGQPQQHPTCAYGGFGATTTPRNHRDGRSVSPHVNTAGRRQGTASADRVATASLPRQQLTPVSHHLVDAHVGYVASVPRYHPIASSEHAGCIQSKHVSPPRPPPGAMLERGSDRFVGSGRSTPPPAAANRGDNDGTLSPSMPYERAMRHPLLDL